MNYDWYNWKEPRNAVGFAAECARAVVHCIAIYYRASFNRVVALAEKYAQGDDVPERYIRPAYDRALSLANNMPTPKVSPAACAARAALHALSAAESALVGDTRRTTFVVKAQSAGADAKAAKPDLDVELVRFNWIAIDLGVEPTDAVIGALTAGNVEMAKQIGAAQ